MMRPDLTTIRTRLMELAFTPEEDAFRAEVQTFLNKRDKVE